jgi:hypothetical protein
MYRAYELALVAVATVVAVSCAWGTRSSAESDAPETSRTSTTSDDDPKNDDQRVELGDVDWMRDFEPAKARARETEQPMFVLFTEVPGCSTVRGFGRDVLSDPIVVDAIESHFVPVAIFNNVEGEDREVLESFGEPTWNNPVVRLIQPDRTALADRFDGPYNRKALLETIGSALETTEGSVPTYLTLRKRELASHGHRETTVFGMYCFWSGEAGLGRLDGVVRTRPGFMAGTEVVRVTWDERFTSYEALLEAAQASGAASQVYVDSKARLETARSVFGDSTVFTDDDFQIAADDRKYYLQHSRWSTVEMTELQRTKVNSALKGEASPTDYLSPPQRAEVE